MKYRLYIDETGNPDMGSSADPNHRYLSLTGIIVELEHVKLVVHPQMEALKQKYFSSHPDEPIVLHRRELVRRDPPFHALRDRTVEAAFNQDLLTCLDEWTYHVVTVTIDKQEHGTRYAVWRYHPYHYCLHVMLERYIMCLESMGARGDVMGESRGGTEDRTLKESFARIYERGTEYVAVERMQAALTSGEIKLKAKGTNIAGLQMADLIANPSFKSSLASHQNQKQAEDFGGKIIEILLRTKYLRNPNNGRIEGWGRKWLP